MKKIEAIIRPDRLADFRAALEKTSYSGLSVYEVEGHGKQKGQRFQWRGTEYRKDMLPKVKLEIVASDKAYKEIVQAIVKGAATGGVGDGKVFVSTIDEAYRIRSGETGEDVVV